MDPLQLFRNGKPEKSKKKEIVFSENKSVFRARNPKQKSVCSFQIDGFLIQQGPRCDYGLWVEDSRVFLIELKGRDVDHACLQLESTYDYFITHFAEENFEYKPRIVASKVRSAPALNSRKKMFERRTGLRIIVKTKEMEEVI